MMMMPHHLPLISMMILIFWPQLTTNPALNNIHTTNANAENSDVNGLIASIITTGINTRQIIENRDELILPVSSSHDR